MMFRDHMHCVSFPSTDQLIPIYFSHFPSVRAIMPVYCRIVDHCLGTTMYSVGSSQTC